MKASSRPIPSIIRCIPLRCCEQLPIIEIYFRLNGSNRSQLSIHPLVSGVDSIFRPLSSCWNLAHIIDPREG